MWAERENRAYGRFEKERKLPNAAETVQKQFRCSAHIAYRRALHSCNISPYHDIVC